MAASITGTFTIIDRASGPMRKMEAQAKKTMAAIEGVGKAQDQQAKSSGAQQMAKTERGMRNVERSTRSTSTELDKLGNSSRRTGRDVDGLVGKLARLGAAFSGIRAIMRVGLFVGLAAGITALV